MLFEACAPVRGFPSYKGQRHYNGRWWTATTGSLVGYESWLGRAPHGCDEEADDARTTQPAATAEPAARLVLARAGADGLGLIPEV